MGRINSFSEFILGGVTEIWYYIQLPAAHFIRCEYLDAIWLNASSLHVISANDRVTALVACDAAKGAADSATELKGELAKMSGLGFPSLEYNEVIQAVSSALNVG